IDQLALGVRRIATTNMAHAVRALTVQRGLDPRSFTLVAFGGAGGQHAIDIAIEMEMSQVLFPPLASTFSALGLLCADVRVTERQAIVRPLDQLGVDEANEVFGQLRQRAIDSLELDEIEPLEQRFAYLRYEGQT